MLSGVSPVPHRCGLETQLACRASQLEQCALLSIEYADLDEIAAADEFWKGAPLLGDLNHSDRKEFICTILDFFRLEYAIHSENYLTQSRIKENEKQFREKLRPPWTLDSNEEIREPYYIRYEPLNRTARSIFQKHGALSPSENISSNTCGNVASISISRKIIIALLFSS